MSQFFQTIENTLTLVGYSIKYAFKHKKLLIVPLVRFVAVMLTAAVSLGLGGLLIYLFKGSVGISIIDKDIISASDAALLFVCLIIFMILVSIVAMLADLTLTHAIGDIFRKGRASLLDAFSKSFRHFGRTVVWAATHSLVHLIASRDSKSMLGNLLGDVFILGWNLATLFIVPVFAFEDLGVYASVKESAGIFENHFGKTVVAKFSFSKLTLFIGLIPFLLLPVVFHLDILPLFFIMYLFFIAMVVAFMSLADAIFTTALYFYVKGEPTGEIDTQVLERSFAQKE